MYSGRRCAFQFYVSAARNTAKLNSWTILISISMNILPSASTFFYSIFLLTSRIFFYRRNQDEMFLLKVTETFYEMAFGERISSES